MGRLNITYSNSVFVPEFTQSKIYRVYLPMASLIVFLPSDVAFNYHNFNSVSDSDLLENKLFNSILFPIFYPDYYSYDGPNATFCCKISELKFDSISINTFKINVNGYNEYVAKYNNIPAFITFNGKYIILPANQSYFVYLVNLPPSNSGGAPSSGSNPFGGFPPEGNTIKPYLKIIGNSINSSILFKLQSNDNPLPNVTMYVYFENESLITLLTTNSSGEVSYTFNNPGNYSIIITNPFLYIKYFYLINKSTPITNTTLENLTCVSITENGTKYSGYAYLVLPDKSVKRVYVNKTFCFTPKESGRYKMFPVNNLSIEKSIVVLQKRNSTNIKISFKFDTYTNEVSEVVYPKIVIPLASVVTISTILFVLLLVHLIGLIPL